MTLQRAVLSTATQLFQILREEIVGRHYEQDDSQV